MADDFFLDDFDCVVFDTVVDGGRTVDGEGCSGFGCGAILGCLLFILKIPNNSKKYYLKGTR